MLHEDYKVKAEFKVKVKALVELPSKSTNLPVDTHKKLSSLLPVKLDEQDLGWEVMLSFWLLMR